MSRGQEIKKFGWGNLVIALAAITLCGTIVYNVFYGAGQAIGQAAVEGEES